MKPQFLLSAMVWVSLVSLLTSLRAAQIPATVVTGEIVDETTGQPIPARLYVQSADGTPFFPAMAPRTTNDTAGQPAAREPVPDKLVVLTFDDSVASQYTVVRPLLKKHGFGATFFITEGFSFRTNKQDYLTWEQIAELHRDGFEIGNHTRDHMGVSAHTLGLLRQQVEVINERCAEHGIPRPVSFAYPGNSIHPGALPLLKELGFKFARRGGEPEIPYKLGGGVAYEPGLDHPLLIPTAGDARPAWTLEDAKRAANMARNGRIAVFQFHGVPDREHPWVNTPPEKFAEYMEWLHANGYRAIALRDVARYADPERAPADPWAVIQQRQARLARGESLETTATNIQPVASAVRYERRHGNNPKSTELHTTLSADPFRLELPPGDYTFTVERGKECRPVVRQVTVGSEPLPLRFALPRWVNMAARGWFSGDTHVHRPLEEVPNLLLAEDLNVAFPLTYWVTKAFVSPAEGDKSSRATVPSALIRVDETHVAWPRNTEWELFTVNGKSHTLGAVLALGHQTPFTNGAPTVLPVVAAGRRENVLFDLEKHDWPWSPAIVALMNVDLFELANNHVWRAQFALANWTPPAPAYMGLPNGGRFDTEHDWLEYTHRTYWTLLDCGFRMRPTGGTGSGAHPVPLGFGRVYVNLPGGFSYETWLQGLNEGRSFVTTGPMLLADFKTNEVSATILSDEPVTEVEVIVNGEIRQRVAVTPSRNSEGAWEATLRHPLQLDGTSWVALRCWEKRAEGRERFAHTAPRWFDVPGRPLLPRKAEAEFLVRRVQEQIDRSRGVIPPAAIAEYEQALAVYQRIAATAQ